MIKRLSAWTHHCQDCAEYQKESDEFQRLFVDTSDELMEAYAELDHLRGEMKKLWRRMELMKGEMNDGV